MSFEYDPVTSVQHYPLALKRFGQNGYGQNLWRIVLTSSRRHLVGGSWNGSGCGYHWVPKYRKVKAAWILERWRSAWDLTKMTRAMWDATMVDPISGWLLLGPYPDRGDYELAWEFDQGVSADNIDQVIAACERGHERPFGEVQAAHKAEYAQEEKDIRRSTRDELCDAITAFGNAPMSARGHGRGSKNADMPRSAEELGLRTPRKQRVPVGTDMRGISSRNVVMAGRI